MGISPDPTVPDADCSSTGEERLEVLKLCSRCKTLKPPSAFNTSKTSPDGLRQACRSCSKTGKRSPARERAWRLYGDIKVCKTPTAARNRSKYNPEGLSVIDLLERWFSK